MSISAQLPNFRPVDLLSTVHARYGSQERASASWHAATRAPSGRPLKPADQFAQRPAFEVQHPMVAVMTPPGCRMLGARRVLGALLQQGVDALLAAPILAVAVGLLAIGRPWEAGAWLHDRGRLLCIFAGIRLFALVGTLVFGYHIAFPGQ